MNPLTQSYVPVRNSTSGLLAHLRVASSGTLMFAVVVVVFVQRPPVRKTPKLRFATSPRTTGPGSITAAFLPRQISSTKR